MIAVQVAMPAAKDSCHAAWLVCTMDAHEGAGTWLAGVATLAAVVAALLMPLVADFRARQRRREAFFAFLGHAHALVRMYFNTNDAKGNGATVETRAVRVLLQSALQATEDAIRLKFLAGGLMIGALNMRTSLNFMLLDLDRASGNAPHVSAADLKGGYAALRPDIEKWRDQLKALGADVGEDEIVGTEPHIVRP